MGYWPTYNGTVINKNDIRCIKVERRRTAGKDLTHTMKNEFYSLTIHHYKNRAITILLEGSKSDCDAALLAFKKVLENEEIMNGSPVTELIPANKNKRG